MNVELLRKVQKHIKEEPRRLDMDIWVRSFDAEDVKEDNKLPPCGTTACIAGTACLLAGKVMHHPFYPLGLVLLGGHVSDIAAKLLEIDDAQAGRLFHVTRWPDKYRSDYQTAETPDAKARVAYDYIDRFIKSGGAE